MTEIIMDLTCTFERGLHQIVADREINERRENFEKRLQKFVDVAQRIINDHYMETWPTKAKEDYDVLEIQEGKRYAKIVRKDPRHSGGSVHCFVDKTNGDILKAASWKAPAKQARGNIFDEDFGASTMTQWGCKYLK
jgi:hypothetical protein